MTPAEEKQIQQTFAADKVKEVIFLQLDAR